MNKRFRMTLPSDSNPWYSVTDTKTGRLLATFSRDMPEVKGFDCDTGSEFARNITELLNADAVEPAE